MHLVELLLKTYIRIKNVLVLKTPESSSILVLVFEAVKLALKDEIEICHRSLWFEMCI